MRGPAVGAFSISNSQPGPGGQVGWPIFGLPPWKNYRRRDRNHLLPPCSGMDAISCRTEVCYLLWEARIFIFDPEGGTAALLAGTGCCLQARADPQTPIV
jgi:hypothetical protein